MDWIVYYRTADDLWVATLKKSKLAAVRAYNKLHGCGHPEYGWTEAESAYYPIRRAAGLA